MLKNATFYTSVQLYLTQLWASLYKRCRKNCPVGIPSGFLFFNEKEGMIK